MARAHKMELRRSPVGVLFALLGTLGAALPADASVDALMAELNGLETMLHAEVPFDRRERGEAIHGYHTRIWEHMADLPGSAIKRLPENRTFLGKTGTHVFGVGEIPDRVYVDTDGRVSTPARVRASRSGSRSTSDRTTSSARTG